MLQSDGMIRAHVEAAKNIKSAAGGKINELHRQYLITANCCGYHEANRRKKLDIDDYAFVFSDELLNS